MKARSSPTVVCRYFVSCWHRLSERGIPRCDTKLLFASMYYETRSLDLVSVEGTLDADKSVGD